MQIDKLRSVIIDYAERDTEVMIYSRHSITIPVGMVSKCFSVRDTFDFKMDTGAGEVTITAQALGIKLSEKEFTEKYNKKAEMRVGIVRTEEVRYYTIIMDELKIGNITLKGMPVKITFDKRVESKLLGMSLLGLFDVNMSSTFKTVTFTETQELAEYTHKNRPIINPSRLCREQYIDLTLQDMEANYIHKKALDKE